MKPSRPTDILGKTSEGFESARRGDIIASRNMLMRLRQFFLVGGGGGRNVAMRTTFSRVPRPTIIDFFFCEIVGTALRPAVRPSVFGEND